MQMSQKILPDGSLFTIDDHAFDQFREIRKRVWFEATRNKPENQRKLREMVVKLSETADLGYSRTNAPQVLSELWMQIVEKIFYSGFNASTVNAKLDHLLAQFGDYKGLCSPDWEVCIKNRQVSGDSGRLALAYAADDVRKEKIRHAYKLRKIVKVGRHFSEYFDEHAEACALSFVTRQMKSEDVWLLSDNLDRAGLTGRLTQLHLMMDLGFDCIKPDIVISRLVLSLDWFAQFSCGLPSDLSEADLRGKGKYGGRYHYANDAVIRPIVDLARAFASKMRQEGEKLKSDIGWVSSNPIREFDIFMVTFGQRPDPKWGIEIQLWAGNSDDSGSRVCSLAKTG